MQNTMKNSIQSFKRRLGCTKRFSDLEDRIFGNISQRRKKELKREKN